MAKRGDTVRAKRLGWDGSMNGTPEEDFDPYDYPDDVVEGEYDELVTNENYDLLPVYTNYVVNGQPVDPSTVEVLEEAK